MSVSPAPAESSGPELNPVSSKADATPGAPRGGARWKEYLSPILVVLLALAILISITRN